MSVPLNGQLNGANCRFLNNFYRSRPCSIPSQEPRMKRAALTVLIVGLVASPAFAQGRGKNRQGIPPGQLPPAGLCRVWYDGVPPGRQPGPTGCNEAERIASRDSRARVIYGSTSNRNAPVYRDYPQYPGDIWRGDDGRYPSDQRYPSTDGRRPNPTGESRGRAVPRDQYPGTYPYPDSRYPQDRGGYGYSTEAFRKGYDDGVVKGREDVRDGDSFDPARHSWYRSADRGYNSRYGTRDEYRAEYRRGFLAGYESEHDGRQRSRSSWWPF